MADKIDLVVFVALHEEADHVISTLPSGYEVVEDHELSVTYYRFKILSISEDAEWSVLLVAAGAMGPTRAATITGYIYAKFRPDFIAVLGISGSLDPNVLLGDVVIPKSIKNYLAVGAASPGRGGALWGIEPSGNSFSASPRLLDRVNNFKHLYKLQWESWKRDTAALREETLGSQLPQAIEAGVTRRDPAVISEEVNLASSDLVGKADEFVKWLKGQDRKFAAIDMESSGVFDIGNAVDEPKPKIIAIRGISDFADERKQLVEQRYKGAFRQIAIENAATFLWAAVQANLLVKAALPVSSKKAVLRENALEFLETTEVIFQHRLKAKVTLSDLFVYPDMMTTGASGQHLLERMSTAMLSDFSNLPDHTLLIGESQSGKTALLKMLYKKYYEDGYTPVYIRGNDIRHADFDRMINKAFREQYETDEATRLNPESTIVLIDDFERVALNRNTQHRVLEKAAKTSRKMLVVGSKELVLADTKFADFASFKMYELLPFGHARRSELIQNWIRLGRESSIQEIEVLREHDIVKRHIDSMLLRNVVPAKPLFICSILQQLEMAAPSDFTLTSYGHCYQALIIQSFVRAGVSHRQLDGLVNYLIELAYFMLCEGSDQLTEGQFDKFASQYNEKYLAVGNASPVDTLLRCGILRKNEDGEISFAYKYIQYFYCAKYLCDNYNDPEIKKRVEVMCSEIYLDKNANVIIFMAHHSKDQHLIDEILLSTMLRFSGTLEAKLSPEETAHFVEYEDLIPQLVIEQRNVQEERRRELEARDRVEVEDKSLSDGEEIRSQEEGSEEAKRRKFFAEAHSSIKSIDLLGQILRNRYGSFRKDQLRSLAEEAIKVGLRLLTEQLRITRDYKEDIVELLEQLMQEEGGSKTDAEIGRAAKQIYLLACYWSTVGIIERIASTIGMEEMLAIFDEIVEDASESIAVRLIYVSICLNSAKIIPRRAISSLYKDMEGDRIGQRMLRQMVLRYLYLNPTDYKDKQWFASELKLPVRSQMLIGGAGGAKK